MTSESANAPNFAPYVCNIPVAIFIFNRPDNVRLLIDALRPVAPKRIYAIADGPRAGNGIDVENVAKARDAITGIDWKCELHTNYSDTNLSLKKRFVTGLSWLFEREEKAIILEDDCIPTRDFFHFCEWALMEFEKSMEIAIISGTNLIDYAGMDKKRNGFSNYINIWGWATWRRTWEKVDTLMSGEDIQTLKKSMKADPKYRSWEITFWTEIFKLQVMNKKCWEYYIQFYLFKNGLLSVYPSRNLIKNIGFGNNATNTQQSPPEYWLKSVPKEWDTGILSLPVNRSVQVSIARDRLMTKTIWNCTRLRAIRLKIMNMVRYWLI